MEHSMSTDALQLSGSHLSTSVPSRRKISDTRPPASPSGGSLGVGNESTRSTSARVSEYDFSHWTIPPSRTSVSWDETAVNGEHVWAETNKSGELCFMPDSECTRSGSKRRCTICKMIIHSACIPNLIFPCRLTFREAGIRDYREGKLNEIFTSHHWVHRKQQNGKCAACGRSFQAKFSFNAREIVAVQCSWCKLAYHNKPTCFPVSLLKETCTRGSLANVIVPIQWVIKLPSKANFKSSVRGVPSEVAELLKEGNEHENHNNAESSTHDSSGLGNPLGDCPFLLKPTPMPRLRPIVVFINPKSGGNQGAKLMQKFMWMLNPRQVFDLSENGPKLGLQLFGKVPNLRILACGGDGTAGWIMSVMDALSLPFAPIAVLPLGTGNDLARTLNWGGAYNSDEPLSKTLSCVEEGKVVSLDRWSVVTRPLLTKAPSDGITMSVPLHSVTGSHTSSTHAVTNNSSVNHFSSTPGLSQSVTATMNEVVTAVDNSNNCSVTVEHHTEKTISNKLPLNVFNNYFSLGADAAVALEFHESREANPEKFSSRLRNKIFYAGAGGKDVLKRSWRSLGDFITLECDGVDMTERLRELHPHVLLFLNIPRYSSGTLPWGNPNEVGSYRYQRMDDNYLEVMCMSSATLATLQVGGHADRLCQCRTAILTTNRSIPMQLDGEPCRLVPSVIEIKRRNQANLILKPKVRNSMPLLNEEYPVDNVLSLSRVAQSLLLKLTVMWISLSNYEKYSNDVDLLKKSATFHGILTVESNANLGHVRQLVTHMGKRNGSDLPFKSWSFLDTCTTDRFFRLERSHENNYFITDICHDVLYLVCMVANTLPTAEGKTETASAKPSIAGEPATSVFTGESSSSVATRISIDLLADSNEEDAAIIEALEKVVDSYEYDIDMNPHISNCTLLTSHSHSLNGNEPNYDNSVEINDEDSLISNHKHNHLPQDESEADTNVNKSVQSLSAVSHKNNGRASHPADRAVIKACRQNDLNRLMDALATGGNILAVDSAGRSSLHWAAKLGHKKIVEYLLSCDSKQLIELREFKHGQTALHKAAAYRRRTICATLIDSGASVLLQDTEGRTPRQLAALAKDNKLALYLRNKEILQMVAEKEKKSIV